MLEYLLFKIGEFLACSVPWSFAYRIGIFLSISQYYISKKDRDAVLNNLRVILPRATKKQIESRAKEVFMNFGLYLVEFLRFKCIDRDLIDKLFTFKGKNFIDAALKEGKGAILLTAHMGNWEVAGMALSILGYKLSAIALDHKDPRINDFFKKRRTSKGMEIISLGVSVKKCFRALKDNRLVAILGDRDFSNSSYSLDFLGRKKKIPRGPAVLSLHTGAPIIPVIITRQGLGCLTFECLPPLRATNATTEIDLTKEYAKIIEDQIYKNPGQWMMFREFWKE